MTTPSKQNQFDELVNQSLDKSINEQLSDEVQQDIAQARRHALSAAKSKNHSAVVSHHLLLSIKQLLSVKVMVPVAVAAGAVMLVNYSYILPTHSPLDIAYVPPLPLAIMDESIPAEDLLLLEDIEFAHWLALQESETQEATL